MKRSATSLVEVLVVVAILALLSGLVIASIQKVRAAAALTKTRDNLRQIILGTHQLSSLQPDRPLGGLPKAEWTNAPFVEQSILELLLPYTFGDRATPQSTWTLEELDKYDNFVPPIYQDPGDFSLYSHPLIKTEADRSFYTSYACNMLCFDRELRYPWGLPDGASNTLAFGQKYALCGSHGGDQMHVWRGCVSPNPADKGYACSRRATLADRGLFRDVLPVKDVDTAQTVASIRGMTFQVRPLITEADARIAQTPHFGGLPVAMFDGSVRTLSPGIAESIYWALFTPECLSG